ncbi:MAG: N-acetyltransferase [Cyclobacteriaceae bacterium]|nr:MAG: N-acetyltransferase [Cyclobacteriaceae bacterium]
MNTQIRQATAEDAGVFGEICYHAFKSIADQYNYPPDFPSPEVAAGLYSNLLPHPKFHSAAAEVNGTVVGSIVVSKRSNMAGISILTVNPEIHNKNIGRKLMEYGISHLQAQSDGIQLIQAAYNVHSFSLYAKLGFDAREMLSTMQGPAINLKLPGYKVRHATENDLEACNRLCTTIHGHHRGVELQDAIQQGSATVVEHQGNLTGYSTAMAFFGHSVGKTNEDLKALIGAASEFQGPGILIPSGNGELLRWCMEHGLRNAMQLTLMSYGGYNEPQGPFMPAILC